MDLLTKMNRIPGHCMIAVACLFTYIMKLLYNSTGIVLLFYSGRMKIICEDDGGLAVGNGRGRRIRREDCFSK